MTRTVVLIFLAVYAGMILGRWPRLRLDRTGIALLGAITVIAAGALSLEGAMAAVDVPTIALLFAFMVLSAQLRLGGFYTRVATAVTGWRLPPPRLLAAVVAVSGGLAAVFTNDIVCLAVAPVLIQTCRCRGLNPTPFLLALACAANVGSAATLIGNPQNILVGQALDLSFAGYLGQALPSSLLGLAVVWWVIAHQYRRDWTLLPVASAPEEDLPNWNPWQAGKGLAVTALLFFVFLFTSWPREILALAGAGVLLCSRRLHSRQMLGLVDWQLLVLFCGLFTVNRALQDTGVPAQAVAALLAAGIDLQQPGWLFGATALLSNLVSNVPAIMLLLPLAGHPLAGPLLALVSTFAGNLLLVGSIANIIVVDAAACAGISIDWHTHARSGVPVTLLTLLLAAISLWLGSVIG